MRTIAIVNQKGGCGKTTTAINLAALYARRGLRTLLVDMDPQSHCAAGLGVPEARIEYSIGDALTADHSNGFDPGPLVWEVARNLYLAPSTVMLSALEAPGGGLHERPDKDRRLESLLQCIGEHYDRCLIDSPPTIGLLTYNALRAAREALIPVETGFFSLRGAEKQWNTIQRMIAHIGRPIACHLMATLHKPDSQLACNILTALRRQFAGQIMPVVIREHEVLREAASFGQPVLEYAPESEARQDFEALADWLEEHAAKPVTEIEVFASNGSTDAPADGLPPPMAIAGNSRAAELARRVHGLSGRAPQPSPYSDSPLPLGEESGVRAEPTFLAHQAQPDAKPFPLGEAPTQLGVSAELTLLAPAAHRHASPLPEEEGAVGSPDLSHVYGVRQTANGVLFVQPASLARKSLAVVGDFNYWCETANPLRFNEQAGVFEALIKLRPGLHEYCLVADGQWIADPHNPNQQLNSYGEPNSVIAVR